VSAGCWEWSRRLGRLGLPLHRHVLDALPGYVRQESARTLRSPRCRALSGRPSSRPGSVELPPRGRSRAPVAVQSVQSDVAKTGPRLRAGPARQEPDNRPRPTRRPHTSGHAPACLSPDVQMDASRRTSHEIDLTRTTSPPSRRLRSGWWAGRLDAAVGVADGELPVRAQSDVPALLVDEGVVVRAHR
jgi:hypothetical protein